MTGTRISDMTVKVLAPGDYVPIISDASHWTNYRVDLGAAIGGLSAGVFSDASSLTVPAGAGAVYTSAYSAAGGGAARYIYDAAVNAAYVLANPRTSFVTLNGRGYRLDPQQWLSVQMFGGVADATASTGTDNLAAFNAAIAFIKSNGISDGGFYVGGPRLRVPAGIYYVSDTIDIKGITLIIEGDGSGLAGGTATRIRFAASKTGFRVQAYNTTGLTSTSPGIGSEGTVIRNLALIGGGGTGSAYGVHMRGRAFVDQVLIESFASHGIAIIATLGSGGATEGNCNGWQVGKVRVAGCGGSGLYVSGADTNAGLGQSIDSAINTGWGIEDNSFLGNTYVACQTQLNTAGAYRASGTNARNQFLGCYSESDQPTSNVSAPSFVWGGLHSAGVTGTGVVLNNNQGAMTVTGGVYTPGGIGVGNYAAASAVGSVVKKFQIYDAIGNPLGYVPIYSSIT